MSAVMTTSAACICRPTAPTIPCSCIPCGPPLVRETTDERRLPRGSASGACHPQGLVGIRTGDPGLWKHPPSSGRYLSPSAPAPEEGAIDVVVILSRSAHLCGMCSAPAHPGRRSYPGLIPLI